MSDPMNRPIDPPSPPIPPESQPRKSATPLVWLLLLVALIAFGWYFYNRRGVDADMPAPTPPAVETADAGMTPNADMAAVSPRSATPGPALPAMPDSEAKAIAMMQPEYPPEALRAGEEGTVMVRVEIDNIGMPTKVEIADSSGSRELDRAGLEAVRNWRFEPAVKNGERVASTVQVPVDFKLDRQ